MSLTKKVLVLIECLGHGLRERDHMQADCVDAAATQVAPPGVSYPSEQDPAMQLTGFRRRVFQSMRLKSALLTARFSSPHCPALIAPL
jgi:hypothetical protein